MMVMMALVLLPSSALLHMLLKLLLVLVLVLTTSITTATTTTTISTTTPTITPSLVSGHVGLMGKNCCMYLWFLFGIWQKCNTPTNMAMVNQ